MLKKLQIPNLDRKARELQDLKILSEKNESTLKRSNSIKLETVKTVNTFSCFINRFISFQISGKISYIFQIIAFLEWTQKSSRKS